jgi:hypothetical protein
MSTTPQLPPPGHGPAVPAHAPPPGYVTGWAPPPGAVPSMPPQRGRSAGFWVGITAAITAGVIAALLIGFFIGRGTRLSNDEVQGKLTQQQQADLIVQQKALNDQKAEISARNSKLIGRVSAKAEARGRREGRSQGRQEGFADGQNSGFSQGQTAGYAQGQSDGYDSGLSTGSCLADYFYC